MAVGSAETAGEGDKVGMGVPPSTRTVPVGTGICSEPETKTGTPSIMT